MSSEQINPVPPPDAGTDAKSDGAGDASKSDDGTAATRDGAAALDSSCPSDSSCDR